MDDPDQEFTREILRKVRHIEIKSNKLVSEALSGSYHSAFKGQGIDFEEVREYQPGDEVRSIDWNVTAKMGIPFVKQYREERELTIILTIDISSSGNWSSTNRSKREKLAELGALLAFSAIKNGDKVGLILFSDQIEKYLPPAKGQKHTLRILREILFHQNASNKTDLNEGLRFLNQVTRRRAVVFLLSDFIIPEYDSEEESIKDLILKELSTTRRKHDLMCCQISDQIEYDMPKIGRISLEDSETHETIIINASSKDFQSKYKSYMQSQNESFAKSLKRRGIDHFKFSTTSDYSKELQEFFLKRRKR